MAKERVKVVSDNPWGFVLFVAYFGALYYFVERNAGFWGDVLAFLQAALWPAYVLYNTLTQLNI